MGKAWSGKGGGHGNHFNYPARLPLTHIQTHAYTGAYRVHLLMILFSLLLFFILLVGYIVYTLSSKSKGKRAKNKETLEGRFITSNRVGDRSQKRGLKRCGQ